MFRIFLLSSSLHLKMSNAVKGLGMGAHVWHDAAEEVEPRPSAEAEDGKADFGVKAREGIEESGMFGDSGREVFGDCSWFCGDEGSKTLDTSAPIDDAELCCQVSGGGAKNHCLAFVEAQARLEVQSYSYRSRAIAIGPEL